MPDSALRRQARRMMADAVAARGPSHANAAGTLRAGYENVWITAGLDAIEAALRTGPDDEPDDSL